MGDKRFDINIGSYEVLKTGTVISLKDNPVTFHIGDLEIVFCFDNTEDGVMNVRPQTENSQKITLTFLNFNAELGCGNDLPYVLGTFEGRELSFLVRFTQLNKGGKTITYTWLLGGKRDESR